MELEKLTYYSGKKMVYYNMILKDDGIGMSSDYHR